MADTVDIKKDYYPFPTQVRFCQRLENGEFTEDNWGIAFHEHIICLGCGNPIDIDDEDVIVWAEIEDSWLPCDEELWNLEE